MIHTSPCERLVDDYVDPIHHTQKKKIVANQRVTFETDTVAANMKKNCNNNKNYYRSPRLTNDKCNSDKYTVQ